MIRCRNLVLATAFAATLTTPAISAQAATCQDELDRFERRLQGSDLATRDPDAFEELLRRSEEAATFRDEEQCLQIVAELNAALPEDPGVQPTSSLRGVSDEAPAEASRPAAPVLLIAGGDDADPASDSGSKDEDDN